MNINNITLKDLINIINNCELYKIEICDCDFQNLKTCKCYIEDK